MERRREGERERKRKGKNINAEKVLLFYAFIHSDECRNIFEQQKDVFSLPGCKTSITKHYNYMDIYV